MAITPLGELKPSLTDAPPGSMVGSVSKPKIQRRSGKDLKARPPACAIMLFGKQGSGKTDSVIRLLLLGYKIVYVQSDYGDSGYETIQNYFSHHPDESHWYEDNFVMLQLNFDATVDFMRNPATAMPEIYDWDPDVIFWDGLTSYQENQVEGYLAKTATQLQNDSGKDWDAWRSARNAVVFPLDHFLRMKNLKTGRPWHKICTCLESVEYEYTKVQGKKGDDRQFIPGSERIMPMLHTTARKIATAGFSITFRTVKKFLGGKDVFSYEFKGEQLDTKDRGYGLPKDMPKADFGVFWQMYVLPHIEQKGS